MPTYVQIAAFRTSDGKVHESRLDAEKAEFNLEVQEFFKANTRNGTAAEVLSGGNRYPVNTIATVIGNNLEGFSILLSKHKAAVNRLKAKQVA